MTIMPAAFLGHGSPVNTLEDNRYTRSWRAFSAAVPEPRAVLVISAHWYAAECPDADPDAPPPGDPLPDPGVPPDQTNL